MMTPAAPLALCLLYLSAAAALSCSKPSLQARLDMIDRTIANHSRILEMCTGSAVVFSAALGHVGDYGRFNTEVTLVFTKVFTNTGSYNPTTGIFTAPISGTYFFSFAGYHRSTRLLYLSLRRNGERVASVMNTAYENHYKMASNAMVMTLEEGDHVYMTLAKFNRIYDDCNHQSTFHGILLYPHFN